MTRTPSTRAEPIKRDECGTMAGWNAHHRHKERLCMACKVSHADYQREWRHRTGRSKGRYYTSQEIADIKAQAVREHIGEQAHNCRCCAADRKAEQPHEAVPTGAAFHIEGDE